MRVVAGLGNPGPRYVWTRHNVGFLAVREMARRWNVALWPGGSALQATATIDGEEIRLVLPQTYMNLSGTALEGVVATPAEERLMVVYDDVDLPSGALRIRRDGGAGGHRGVASIIDSCGSSFVRVRAGVGRPPLGVETADYVLAELSDTERDELLATAQRAADAVECALRDGVSTAMNRFNGMQATPSPEAS